MKGNTAASDRYDHKFGSSPPLSYWFLSPVTSVLLTALGIHVAIRVLVTRISHWSIALVAAAMISVWPLSVVSARVFPPHGYTDEIHAVKAGYPTFWVVLLIAVALRLSMRVRSNSPDAAAVRGPVSPSP